MYSSRVVVVVNQTVHTQPPTTTNKHQFDTPTKTFNLVKQTLSETKNLMLTRYNKYQKNKVISITACSTLFLQSLYTEYKHFLCYWIVIIRDAVTLNYWLYTLCQLNWNQSVSFKIFKVKRKEEHQLSIRFQLITLIRTSKGPLILVLAITAWFVRELPQITPNTASV